MTENTTNRVALVTGGSGGIGRAVAERLAKDGIAVAVHYAGNRAKADETVAAIIAAGGQAQAVGGDVADESEMARRGLGTDFAPSVGQDPRETRRVRTT